MSPRVAVVILNWNSCQMTSDCIRSVLAMDSQSHEIVVVDNGSTDGSAQSLKREFPQITVLPQDRNLGFVAGCNVGIRHAVARDMEYILLLNNDTYVAPDFIREMLSRMENDARIAVVCPKIYFADHPNLLWYAGGDFSLWTGMTKHRGWKEIDLGQFDHRQEITQATGCAMLVRGKALSEVGLLDERFWAYAEDLDWSLRFLKKGYRLAFAPKAHIWHYDGATSVKSMGSGSQAIRQFFSTRNLVFVARKHLSWWEIPTYALGFMFNHIAFYTALRLWRRDFRALLAIYAGLNQGFQTSLSSECAIGARISQRKKL
jgi:hypothetical protein